VYNSDCYHRDTFIIHIHIHKSFVLLSSFFLLKFSARLVLPYYYYFYFTFVHISHTHTLTHISNRTRFFFSATGFSAPGDSPSNASCCPSISASSASA
jgi:hypothetical protein